MDLDCSGRNEVATLERWKDRSGFNPSDVYALSVRLHISGTNRKGVDILEVPVDTAKDAFAQFMLTRESRSVSITVPDLIQHVRHSLLCHDQFY
jgi:hypothetical protein